MNVVAEQLRRYADSVITTEKDIFAGVEQMPKVPVIINYDGRSIKAQAVFPMSVFAADGIRRGVTRGTKRDPETGKAVADGQEWDLRDHDVLGAYVFDPLTNQPLVVQERRVFSPYFSWEPTVVPAEREPLNLVITTHQKLREGVGSIKFQP